MPKCITLKRKHRHPCIGDLDTEIILQDRSLTPPTNTVDYGLIFTEKSTVWAMINTVRGKTEFDSSDIERSITHVITIRFITGVSSETWVLLENERYDIIDTEDLEERHEFIILRCAKLGLTSQPVNDA